MLLFWWCPFSFLCDLGKAKPTAFVFSFVFSFVLRSFLALNLCCLSTGKAGAKQYHTPDQNVGVVVAVVVVVVVVLRWAKAPMLQCTMLHTIAAAFPHYPLCDSHICAFANADPTSTPKPKSKSKSKSKSRYVYHLSYFKHGIDVGEELGVVDDRNRLGWVRQSVSRIYMNTT